VTQIIDPFEGNPVVTQSPLSLRVVGTSYLVQSNGRNIMFDSGGMPERVPLIENLMQRVI
jgi:hypothetical protein